MDIYIHNVYMYMYAHIHIYTDILIGYKNTKHKRKKYKIIPISRI